MVLMVLVMVLMVMVVLSMRMVVMLSITDGGDRVHHRASVKPLNLVHYTGSDRLAEVSISISISISISQ